MLLIRNDVHSCRVTGLGTCQARLCVPHSTSTMHQLHWYSARLRITVVRAHAHTSADERRSNRTTSRGRPLGLVGLAFMALALPVLATERGRAQLGGVLSRYLPPAVRLRALVSSRHGRPALPTGPA